MPTPNLAPGVPDHIVGVIWDEDHGIVSLPDDKVIFYCYGRRLTTHFAVPKVVIEESDFGLIMEPHPGDPKCFEATWDDVTRLLKCPAFDLASRLVQPNPPA